MPYSFQKRRLAKVGELKVWWVVEGLYEFKENFTNEGAARAFYKRMGNAKLLRIEMVEKKGDV